MANRYEKIWNHIKKHAGKPIKIRCRPAKMATIVLAVKKIKSAENVARIGLELGKYGKLQVIREQINNANAVLTFKLLSAEHSENL